MNATEADRLEHDTYHKMRPSFRTATPDEDVIFVRYIPADNILGDDELKDEEEELPVHDYSDYDMNVSRDYEHADEEEDMVEEEEDEQESEKEEEEDVEEEYEEE